MDSKTSNIPLIIGGIVVLGVIAYGTYAFMHKDTPMSDGDMMQKEEGMMKQDTVQGDAMMQDKGAVMEEDVMMKSESSTMEPRS